MTSDDNKAVIDRLYRKAYERAMKQGLLDELRFMRMAEMKDVPVAWGKVDRTPERPESFGTWS